MLLSCLLMSCSAVEDPARQAGSDDLLPEFSSQDKKAASALSISNNSGLNQAEGSYEQAIRCSAAIDMLASRLREVGSYGSELVAGAEKAKAFYDRRAAALPSPEQQSQAGGEREQLLTDAGAPDSETSVRTAMACIQKLQR